MRVFLMVTADITVDGEPTPKPTDQQLEESVRAATEDALKHFEGEGFRHPLELVTGIHIESVTIQHEEPDVCDECGVEYPETAESHQGPWHKPECSLYEAQDPDQWSDDAIFTRQQAEPIFITNGCCEPAHGSPDLFQRLGLSYQPNANYSNGYQYDTWGTAHPLTKEEEVFISEDSADLGNLGWLDMGYSVLYQGKKWLAPNMEICWHESYPDKTADRARIRANRIADALRFKVEGAGGQIYIIWDDEGDRHTLSVLFPFEVAHKHGDFNGWKQFLESLAK